MVTRRDLQRLLALMMGGVVPLLSCKSPGTENPKIVFQALEDRLCQAKLVEVSFHVVAEGVITADFHGTLRIKRARQIQLSAKGLFDAKEMRVTLNAQEHQMVTGNGSILKKDSIPYELKDAIVIGFTRMGILHNVARLSGNAPPDHAAGGVEEWVTVDSFGVDPDRNGAISFGIMVGGRPSGTATLEIGSSGYPVERHQYVRFPTGKMSVVERYSGVKIEP